MRMHVCVFFQIKIQVYSRGLRSLDPHLTRGIRAVRYLFASAVELQE